MPREDRRAKLVEIFGDIKNVYTEITTEFPDFSSAKINEEIEEEERYFASAQGFYKVAVVGSYSTGKTTLLKALFFDRGLYEVDLPTAADITTQVPTIIKLIPSFSGPVEVHADSLTRVDFVDALRWMVDQINKRVALERPNFQDLTANSLSRWVDDVAIPILSQPVRGGTGVTQEHYIGELREAVQIFRTLEPGYKIPTINSVASALMAIKDAKASRILRSISISIPGRNITYPIQLVDLPGMDVPNLAHKQFSYKFIAEEADAVLFLKDAQKPSFTEGEEELLTHIVSKLFDIQHKCFFIFNKWHDTDHPGAEKAVREVINKYHFQSRNIFRISALPALMHMEEKEGIDIESKYQRAQQEWAISIYSDLKKQHGSKLLTEMGAVQLREFLEYYCENNLPMLAIKNHVETLTDVLKVLGKRIEELQIEPGSAKMMKNLEDPNITKCQNAVDTFHENVHGIERRLDDFADSLQESIIKLLEGSHGKVTVINQHQLDDLPPGKLARLFHKMGFGRKKSKPATASSGLQTMSRPLPESLPGTMRRPTMPAPVSQTLRKATGKKTPKELDVPGGMEDTGVIFDDIPDMMEGEEQQELVPQRPVDILTYLEKDVFPDIDVYQRVRVIRHYTSGRSKVHSHEIELAVIRDVNKALREKFLEVLVSIVGHHIEVLCRTIDNEGYIDNIAKILVDLNLHIDLHDIFVKFMESLKTRLNEACGVMAEMAIKQLDEVGVYNDELCKVAALACDNQEQCRQKQQALIQYLRRNYETHLALAFRTLGEEGWDELAEKIAKNREKLVGLLGRHHMIASKIFDERKTMQGRGVNYELSLFEQVEETLREKMAVLKDVAKEGLELKFTQRNAKVAEYAQKIQMLSHQCKELVDKQTTLAKSEESMTPPTRGEAWK
jgi:GTPase SAR1 family protein